MSLNSSFNIEKFFKEEKFGFMYVELSIGIMAASFWTARPEKNFRQDYCRDGLRQKLGLGSSVQPAHSSYLSIIALQTTTYQTLSREANSFIWHQWRS